MRWILTVCMFIGATCYSRAQRPLGRTEMHDAIEKEKVIYLKKNLDLDAQEEKAFWPVYDMQRLAFARLRRERQLYSASSFSLAQLNNMADRDVGKLVNNEMALRQKALRLDMAFFTQSRKILGDKKLARYYRLQEMFKHNLIERIRKEHEEKPH